MHIRSPLIAASLLLIVPGAWAAGGGSMGGGATSIRDMPAPREESPQEKAQAFYNQGVHDVSKADKLAASAAEQTDTRKQERAAHDVQKYYASALAKFEQAVQNDPQMYEAWNYVGYTNRKVGNYDTALAAYERALGLHPGYPEALEYRGEAFLGLNRIADAQQAYLDLFAGNRALADRLLAAMKSWVQAQRATASADDQAVSDLDKWIQERASIAAQTAALTREGTASSWK